MASTAFVSEFDERDDYEDDKYLRAIAKEDPLTLSKLPPRSFAGNSLYYIGTA